MLYNIKAVYLHCVFHGIRFKVNEDWVSVIDTLLFFVNLGICYYNGNGVSKDLLEAVIWFKKSAEQGNADAQYHLGHCYEYGNGVSKDYSQASIWYNRATEQGHEEAKEVLIRFENTILGPVHDLKSDNLP